MYTFTIALELSASAHVDMLICRRAQTGSVASRLILCTCNHRRHSRSSKSTCACVTGCDSAPASAHVDSCVVPFAVRCLQKQTLAVALIHTNILFICMCLSEHPRSLYRWILNHPKPWNSSFKPHDLGKYMNTFPWYVVMFCSVDALPVNLQSVQLELKKTKQNCLLCFLNILLQFAWIYRDGKKNICGPLYPSCPAMYIQHDCCWWVRLAATGNIRSYYWSITFHKIINKINRCHCVFLTMWRFCQNDSVAAPISRSVSFVCVNSAEKGDLVTLKVYTYLNYNKLCAALCIISCGRDCGCGDTCWIGHWNTYIVELNMSKVPYKPYNRATMGRFRPFPL